MTRQSAIQQLGEPEFRELVSKYLLPMFSGAFVHPNHYASTSRQGIVAYKDICRIWIKPAKNCQYRLAIERSQPFDASDKKVMDAFVTALYRIADALHEPYTPDLLDALPRDVVASAVNAGRQEAMMQRVLNELSEWSAQTYEGNRIAVAVGFDPHAPARNNSQKIDDFWKEDFSRVLTNGVDTVLVCSPAGDIESYENIPVPSDVPSFAPFRYAGLADWAKNAKCAVALNRNGEILVLSDRCLQFAKRRGIWHHFTHEPIITQMGRVADGVVKQAVLETCLDVSFARTGGCIAVVTKSKQKEIGKYIDSKDLIENGESTKSLFMKSVLTSKFHEIERARRQELAGIDGALVIDREGTIVAVGAIVTIKGGSSGGGRLAAAKQLSALGLGIKISADGGIRAFKDKKEVFRISDVPGT